MMVWHKDAAQTATVQTQVLNRNGEMFFYSACGIGDTGVPPPGVVHTS